MAIVTKQRSNKVTKRADCCVHGDFHASYFIVLVLFVAILATGCSPSSQQQSQKDLNPTTGNFTEEQLRDRLEVFHEAFDAYVKQAAVQIDQKNDSPRSRRMTLLWRIRMIQAMHEVLSQNNPVVGLIEAWVLSERHRLYLTDGEGQTFFGGGQSIAVNSAELVIGHITRLAREFFPVEQFERTEAQILAFARNNPMSGTFARIMVPATVSRDDQPNPFLDALQLPLAPFQALRGVDRTPAAIGRVADSGDRFSDVVQELPESLRWQLALLFYDIEESDTIQSLKANAAEFSKATSDLAGTADELPERLRNELAVFFFQIDRRVDEINEVLGRVTAALTLIQATLPVFEKTSADFRQTALALTESAQASSEATSAISGLIAQIHENRRPDAEPFNVLKYRDTAQAIGSAATEMTGTVEQIQEFTGDTRLTQRIEDLEERLNNAIDKSVVETQNLLNQLTLRAAGLIVLAFLLALIYRIFVARKANH